MKPRIVSLIMVEAGWLCTKTLFQQMVGGSLLSHLEFIVQFGEPVEYTSSLSLFKSFAK